MATSAASAAAALSSLTIRKKAGAEQVKRNVRLINCGLKGYNKTSSLGSPASLEVGKAMVYQSKGRSAPGSGELAVRHNAAAEIFQIASVINGLVLIGVAVGFVLLRLEASVEEAEE